MFDCQPVALFVFDCCSPLCAATGEERSQEALLRPADGTGADWQAVSASLHRHHKTVNCVCTEYASALLPLLLLLCLV